jgi:hypothetical protein
MRIYAVLGTAAAAMLLVASSATMAAGPPIQLAQGMVPPPPDYPLSGAASLPPSFAADASVETRGPVHEAFAEPVMAAPQPTIVINQAPPAPINEIPPAERPVGVNVVWIPGYWGWDDDRSDFIWISGIWRVEPPACDWVPGYWTRVVAGWQWVPGFWQAEAVQEVEYLPAPPAPVEIDPVGMAPGDDYVWASGYWEWNTGRYGWRSGVWIPAQMGWVWIPPHYIWTPRGYIFVYGHWDYALERRGLMFAPVYFGRRVYLQSGFYYSPSVIIDVGSLSLIFFTRPDYGHYYFGDYYDAVYVRHGIYPWYAFRDRHQWYDPLYAHEVWRHRRDDPRWDEHTRHEYDVRRDDRQARPPRTFADQQRLVRDRPDAAGKVIVAQSLTDFTKSKRAAVKFEAVTPESRTEIQQKNKDLQQYQSSRAKWEAAPATTVEKAPPKPPSLRLKTPPTFEKPVGPVVRPPETRRPEERVVTPPPDTRRPPERVITPPERVVTPPPPETRRPPERVITPPERIVTPPPPETRRPEERVITPPPDTRRPPDRVITPPDVRQPDESPSPPRDRVNRQPDEDPGTTTPDRGPRRG